MAAASTFPDFPKLPAELRQKIFGMGVAGRIMEIAFSEISNRFYCRSGHPPLLLVNQEARSVAMEYYIKVPLECDEGKPNYIYLLLGKDVIYLGYLIGQKNEELVAEFWYGLQGLHEIHKVCNRLAIENQVACMIYMYHSSYFRRSFYSMTQGIGFDALKQVWLVTIDENLGNDTQGNQGSSAGDAVTGQLMPVSFLRAITHDDLKEPLRWLYHTTFPRTC